MLLPVKLIVTCVISDIIDSVLKEGLVRIGSVPYNIINISLLGFIPCMQFLADISKSIIYSNITQLETNKNIILIFLMD